MTLDEIKKLVPTDWLKKHWQEYIHLSEKIAKTIMLTKSAEKGWKTPLRTEEDHANFCKNEAKDLDVTPEKVGAFLIDAGKVKARNTVFDKYYGNLLPKDDTGKYLIPQKLILQFIEESLQSEVYRNLFSEE